jgi:histidyl-tRNA synthetase
MRAHGIDTARTSALVAIVDEWSGDVADGRRELVEAGFSETVAQAVGGLLGCADIPSIRTYLREQGAETDAADALEEVLDLAVAIGMPPELIRVDPSITRGHDYYTGTVFETFAVDREHWGAIGSGGRYDSLLGKFLGRPFPGVGVSLGLTRLMGLMAGDREFAAGPEPVASVLLAYADTAAVTGAGAGLAARMREAGNRVQLLSQPADQASALAYAKHARIPRVVWVPQGATDTVTVCAPDGEERIVEVTDVLSHM